MFEFDYSDFAQAAFLIPFILPFVGGSILAANIVVAVGSIALSVGLSWAAQKLFGPKQPGQQQDAGGVELDLRVDADVPQSLILGRAVTAGSLPYAETYGKRADIDNSDLIQIIAIADHTCEGLVKVYVEAQEATLSAAAAGTPDRVYGTAAENRGLTVDGYDNKIALQFYDGTQTVADELAVAGLSSHPERPYTSARVGRGCTYARIHSIYDKEKVTGPLPWKFVVDGIELYDPRLDTTVGGSGSHRWATLSTHTFTANLAVILYNILRGIRVLDADDVPQHFYGLENTPAASLPLASWFAAMNECDVVIDGEPQFHGGAEITVNTDPVETIRQILKACDGRLSELGGVYKLRVGAPGLPVISFDDGALSAKASDEFNPILPLTQRVNYVTGQFTSPDDGWVPKVAPPRADAALETADGRRLPADLNVPMVQSAAHMQRLQKQMLLRSRRQRRHTITLPPSCFGLEPGDIVEWNSVRNGYIDKLFEVDNVDLHSNLFSTVSLIEVDPDDYNWVAATDLIDQPVPSLTVTRPAPKIIDGFDAQAVLHTGDNGVQRPAIQVTWDVPADGDLTSVDIELRRASIPLEVVNMSGNDVQFESVLILSGLAPATEYEVRGKYVSFNGYETTWSLWIPVTTHDTRVSQDELSAELDARIRQIDQMIDEFEIKRIDIEELVKAVNSQATVLRETIGRSLIGLGSRYLQNKSLITTLVDEVRDPVTGIEARARITQSDGATVGFAGGYVVATSGRVLEIESEIDNPDTGLNARAIIHDSSLTEVDFGGGRIVATSVRVGEIETEIDDPETGLNARAIITGSSLAEVDFGEGRTVSTSFRVDGIESEIDNPDTGLNARARITSADVAQVTFNGVGGPSVSTAGRVLDIENDIYDAVTGLDARARITSTDVSNVTFASGQIVSTAARVGLVESGIAHPTTGLAAKATIIQANITDVLFSDSSGVNRSVSTSTARHLIENTLNNVQTGLATKATISQSDANQVTFTYSFDGVQFSKITATSQRVTDIESDVYHPETGLEGKAKISSFNGTEVVFSDGNVVAKASRVTTLEGEVRNSTTGLDSKASVTYADGIGTAASSALGFFRQTLFAESGDNSAYGKMRFAVAATASGAVATYAVEINVGTLGAPDFRSAGIYLDAMSGFSRIRLIADQTRICATPTAAGDVAFRAGTVNGVAATVIDSLFLEDGATVNEKYAEYPSYASSGTKPREFAAVVMRVTKGAVQVTWEAARLSFRGGNPGGNEGGFIEVTVDGSVYGTPWIFRTIRLASIDGSSGAAQFDQGVTLSRRIVGLSNGDHTFRIRFAAMSDSVSCEIIGTSSLTVVELRNRIQ